MTTTTAKAMRDRLELSLQQVKRILRGRKLREQAAQATTVKHLRDVVLQLINDQYPPDPER